jgi:hypothetical protein
VLRWEMTNYIPESVKNSSVYQCSGASFRVLLGGKWLEAERTASKGVRGTDRGIKPEADGSGGSTPLGE